MSAAIRRLPDRIDLGVAFGLAPVGVRTSRLRGAPGRGGSTTLAAPDANLLVLDGALLRTVRVGKRASAMLLGPGDVVPSAADEPSPFGAGLRVLTPTTAAVLDDRAMGAIFAHRELSDQMVSAVDRQAAMLMLQTTLSQLTTVSERLDVLLPNLADRWGTVSSSGVVLPAFLSHSVLSELIGVRRPSLTTALAEMGGMMARLDDRRWLLAPAVAGLAA